MRCKLWGADSENGQTSLDKTLLTAAACVGDADMFQYLLAQGHDYATAYTYLGVPLCCAAVAGSYRIVETLLALGIDAYRQYRMASCKRDTPLKAAAYASHRDIVLLLPRSCTPILFLHEHAILCAVDGGHEQLAEELVTLIKPDYKFGERVLRSAAAAGLRRAVIKALDDGADINARPHYGTY